VDAAANEGAAALEAVPASSVPPVPAVATPPAAPVTEEPLELPKGALVALRKSGGMKFSSHEVVVYPDGRVTLEGGDTTKTVVVRATRRLLDVQIVRMRRALEQSGFVRMKSQAGNQPPDAFAYELAARVGNRSNRLEFFTGSVPNSLQSLVEMLTQLLPSE
jgi:hypothetical protein